MPDPAREILRLQALVRQKDEELERREMEWRMRNLPPNVGDVTGSTSRDNVTLVDPMDTSDVNRVADDLLSQSGAGGSGGGGGDGLQQQEMPPPPVV